MGVLARIVARHPGTVVALALVLWALALLPASQLRLRFELESLLPGASPAAAAYGEYLRLFGGVRRVFVILQAPHDADDVG